MAVRSPVRAHAHVVRPVVAIVVVAAPIPHAHIAAEWYLYFDELQMRNSIGKPYDIKKIPSLVLSRPEFGIDIEYYGKFGHKRKIQPDIKSKTSDELKQILRQEILIDNIWRKPHNKEHLTNPFAF